MDKQFTTASVDKSRFLSGWNEVEYIVHSISKGNGFWSYEAPLPSRKLIISQKLCLIHSEITEGLEAIREDSGLGNLGEELADAVIRIMDLSYHYNLNVGEEIINKMLINIKRSYKHGKKF